MDKKIKHYIGWGLGVILLLLGLNAFFGGDQMIVGGIVLLPVFAIITPIYFIAFMRKKN